MKLPIKQLTVITYLVWVNGPSLLLTRPFWLAQGIATSHHSFLINIHQTIRSSMDRSRVGQSRALETKAVQRFFHPRTITGQWWILPSNREVTVARSRGFSSDQRENSPGSGRFDCECSCKRQGGSDRMTPLPVSCSAAREREAGACDFWRSDGKCLSDNRFGYCLFNSLLKSKLSF